MDYRLASLLAAFVAVAAQLAYHPPETHSSIFLLCVPAFHAFASSYTGLYERLQRGRPHLSMLGVNDSDAVFYLQRLFAVGLLIGISLISFVVVAPSQDSQKNISITRLTAVCVRLSIICLLLFAPCSARRKSAYLRNFIRHLPLINALLVHNFYFAAWEDELYHGVVGTVMLPARLAIAIPFCSAMLNIGLVEYISFSISVATVFYFAHKSSVLQPTIFACLFAGVMVRLLIQMLSSGAAEKMVLLISSEREERAVANLLERERKEKALLETEVLHARLAEERAVARGKMDLERERKEKALLETEVLHARLAEERAVAAGNLERERKEKALLETEVLHARLAEERAVATGKVIQARSEAERSLNEFLAHEVRNPLSVAIAGLRAAQLSAQSTESGEEGAAGLNLEMVQTSLEFINELTSNILDLNKFAAGEVELKPKRCSLLHDILSPTSVMLAQPNSAVVLSIEPETEPLWVEVDTLRLKQVLVNLAKNAVKFVDGGFILLGAKRNTEEQVELWVADSGPGIPPEKADALFRKYTQLNQHNQGTGVGLALCLQICTQMGGSIAVDLAYKSGSPHGPGARFVVTLPLAEVAAPEDGQTGNSLTGDAVATSLVLRGRYKVLIVDDDVMLRVVWGIVFAEISESRWEVDVCEHGEACLERVANTAYDIIVMDQFMASSGGCLTGSETIKRLRERGVTSFIVGSSGNDMAETHVKAGADLFWRKPPPPPPEMAKQLVQLLPLPSAWRVLVAVSDSDARCSLVTKLHCALLNSEVVEATSENEALALLEEEPGVWSLALCASTAASIDLFVLDEGSMDAVARKIRSTGSSVAIVVGLFATTKDATDRAQSMAADCDTTWSLNDSIDETTIRATLLECLRSPVPTVVHSPEAVPPPPDGEATDAKAPGAAASDSNKKVPAAEALAHSERLAEMQRVREMFGDDGFRSIGEAFISSTVADADTALTHIAAGAWGEAQARAHKIKGALLSLDYACAATAVELDAVLKRLVEMASSCGGEEALGPQAEAARALCASLIAVLAAHAVDFKAALCQT